MLHFRMNMPFVLMAFYGSLMIIIVLLLRALLKRRLPKFVFPVLWCVVLLRLLVPFSISSPISIKSSLLSLPYVITNTWNEYFPTVYLSENAYDIAELQGYNYNDSSYTSENAVVEGTADTADTATITVSYTDGASADSFPQYISGQILLLLPVIYFLGLLATVCILLLQKYRYSAKLKNRLLIEHNETINSILREMDMGHVPVFTNDEIASPLVCGLFAPRIYLPTRMDFRNTELLRHILTHETMHIKRRDNWVKTIMLAALCTNWFNPLVWLMSKCLSSDLEAACDEAVLRLYNDDEQRKSYASSLLTMAITGNRSTLLYSAFSKTEVEKRIQSILHYKKSSALILIFAVIFMLCSSTVFATCPQAPFSSYLTSFCASSSSRWGAKVELTRDIALGSNPQRRAEDIVFDILGTDTTNDPELIEIRMLDALSEEFHVEKSAFHIDISLCISNEERNEEYASWELTQDKNGIFLYKGESVRTFVDETGSYYQSKEEGTVDIRVLRDRYGYITAVSALHEGDSDFDRRTRDIERQHTTFTYDGAMVETTLTENYDYYVR